MNCTSTRLFRFPLILIGVLLISAGTFVSYSPALTESAVSAVPITGMPWTRGDAAHLLRRAGFGGTPEQIDKLFALGRDGAMDYLLDGKLPPNALPVFAPIKLEDFKLLPVDELTPQEQETIAKAQAVKRAAKRPVAQTQPVAPAAPADQAVLDAAKALKNKGKRDQ